jgi:hypothetical protein
VYLLHTYATYAHFLCRPPHPSPFGAAHKRNSRARHYCNARSNADAMLMTEMCVHRCGIGWMHIVTSHHTTLHRSAEQWLCQNPYPAAATAEVHAACFQWDQLFFPAVRPGQD